MDKYRSPPGQVMTDDQIKNAWNITLKAMFEAVMDDHEATDEGLSRRKRRKKTMADSIVGSFSDSDVNQRSGTFCVMDVQTILFNAYKT